jgi:hypothetical protein
MHILTALAECALFMTLSISPAVIACRLLNRSA